MSSFGAHSQPLTSTCAYAGSIGWHSDPPILLANTSEDTEEFLKVYARPVYVQKNVSGIPYDLLKFDRNSSGSIWYDPDREADFADWDDFFEYPCLHDNLELLIEDEYSIHISFTGSRWYGTIFPANVTISEHFHRDYHVSPHFGMLRTKSANLLNNS